MHPVRPFNDAVEPGNCGDMFERLSFGGYGRDLAFEHDGTVFQPAFDVMNPWPDQRSLASAAATSSRIRVIA